MREPDPQTFSDPQAAPPQVFVRVFQAPAGLPWEQARAAQLEARHGAPLPIADVIYQLRRLGGWSLGQPGRYAVFYVRAAEYHTPFETTLSVEGAPIRVAFGAGAAQMARARRLGVIALIGAITLAVGGGGLALALSARAESEARLDLAEQTLQAKSRQTHIAVRQAEQTQALGRATQGSQPISTVLTDLAWASAARTPDARIAAVHWDHSLMGVEVRGETAPFAAADRRIERSARQIRPGVWLWGVQADPNAASGGPP